MQKYGEAAIRATELVRGGACKSVLDAWRIAVDESFDKQSLRDKQCPKNTFLGLCQEGFVVGVPPPPSGTHSTTAPLNKKYALVAVRILQQDPSYLADGPEGLWRRVMEDSAVNGDDPASSNKRHNSQMDVVLALWAAGLIATDQLVTINKSPEAVREVVPIARGTGSGTHPTKSSDSPVPTSPIPEPPGDRNARLHRVKLLVEIFGGVVTVIGAVVALIWRSK